jgi:hypothetical protein
MNKMRRHIYFLAGIIVLTGSSVFADCTSNPAANVPTGNFSTLAWTYSATGDACSNLATANYLGNVTANLANGTTLTMNLSIRIDGNFNLTNQGSSTLTVPNGVTVEITGDLGDATNNSVTYNIEAGGTLIVGGTIYGKNSNAFTGTGTVSAGGLDFNQPPTCVDPDCPVISAGTCEPAASSFCTGALPIELLEFKATVKVSIIVLDWSTASEENNDYYSIERSRDGVDYELIATMPGAGNSTSVLEYSYTDANPLFGRSYYRLKQTDFDGASETFKPIAVDFTTLTGGELNFSPNPVNRGEKITIVTQTNDDELLNISVYNMVGEVVSSNEFTGPTFDFSLSQATRPGIYFIKVSSVKSQETGILLVK